MDGLSNLDQVAYVRFASVYTNFKEVKDFEDFVGNLNVYKPEVALINHNFFMELSIKASLLKI